jgi:hypothetical protein
MVAMEGLAYAWRGRAAGLALLAAAVAVTVIVAEGPPGSGYGWGSVWISVGIVAALFILMAYLVRYDTVGRALASAVVAAVLAVLFTASLIGNWAAASATARILDSVSTVLAVAASGLVFVVATATVRHSRSSDPHTLH